MSLALAIWFRPGEYRSAVDVTRVVSQGVQQTFAHVAVVLCSGKEKAVSVAMATTALFLGARVKNKAVEVRLPGGRDWVGLISVGGVPSEMLLAAAGGKPSAIATGLAQLLADCGAPAKSTEGAKTEAELEDPETHEIDEHQLKWSAEVLQIAQTFAEAAGEEGEEDVDAHAHDEGGDEEHHGGKHGLHRKGHDHVPHQTSSDSDDDADEGADGGNTAKLRPLVEMVTQGFAMAVAMGLTPDDAKEAWVAAGGPAVSDEELKEMLAGGHGGGDEDDEGEGHGIPGMPPGAKAECKQQ